MLGLAFPAILAIGLSIFTIVAWARRWWSIPGRVHYTLVTFAGLVFTWWLAYRNLRIGYSLFPFVR